MSSTVTPNMSVLNATSARVFQHPFNNAELIMSATILITFMVIGIVANTLTIAVIASYKTLNNTVFMRFILSLCISDLTSAAVSWLYLYRRTWGFDVWGIPFFFCELYWATDILTSYVTALHILSFAILRYISIRCPFLYQKITVKHGNIWIMSIWVISFACGFTPFMFFFGAKVRNRFSNEVDASWPACSVLIERHDQYMFYQNIAYPIFLLSPAIGVLGFCLLIILIVSGKSKLENNTTRESCRKNERRMRKEKQAVWQLLLIIASFIMGYIPFVVYEFWSLRSSGYTVNHWKIDYWFGMSEYFLLRFSECLNPLFYNLGSSKMRSHTFTFIKKKLCPCFAWKIKPAPSTRRPGSSDMLRTSGTDLGV